VDSGTSGIGGIVQRWRERRAALSVLCVMCREAPRREGDLYCSEECAEASFDAKVW